MSKTREWLAAGREWVTLTINDCPSVTNDLHEFILSTASCRPSLVCLQITTSLWRRHPSCRPPVPHILCALPKKCPCQVCVPQRVFVWLNVCGVRLNLGAPELRRRFHSSQMNNTNNRTGCLDRQSWATPCLWALLFGGVLYSLWYRRMLSKNESRMQVVYNQIMEISLYFLQFCFLYLTAKYDKNWHTNKSTIERYFSEGDRVKFDLPSNQRLMVTASCLPVPSSIVALQRLPFSSAMKMGIYLPPPISCRDGHARRYYCRLTL